MEDVERVGELVRLSQIEYEQEPGVPNLIGWPVADQDGHEFAVLDDMLVDIDTGEVPFASICYENKCTAIPLDVVFLDEPSRKLLLPVGKEDLEAAPDFTDDTEDVQPFVDFWNDLASQWDAEEESELDDGD